MLASVDRTGRLLSLFTPDRTTHGVSEIALALGISKSSAHALVQSLEEIGLLRQGADRRYMLGWGIIQLHRSLLTASDLYDAAAQRVRMAHRRTGCAIAVVVPVCGGADVLLAAGRSAPPTAAATAMASGQPVPLVPSSAVAPIYCRAGGVVGVVEVGVPMPMDSAPAGAGGCAPPAQHGRIASAVAGEITEALRAAQGPVRFDALAQSQPRTASPVPPAQAAPRLAG